ncbi:MAG: 16S rRNA (adenine(1518)-N(6)/adenine(1519)-N(6))-dimethyltransferase RsmA [Oligoflexia bacterium]|nr:16S rRNA (adenine(1518)-N(6)/adenine(1519)-N(6))-dimethyltransferase RsmA [Oligoflexia bacterium]
MKRKRVFAKKSLGQNFLVDQKAIQTIVDQVPETELLLEIGPGRGAISTHLVGKSANYFLLEKDDELASAIGTTLFVHGSRTHHVFHDDALEFNWEKIWSEKNLDSSKKLVVVGNLPYNVATEILFRLLDLEQKIEKMVLMFQKEVGDRIAAKPGTKHYGFISIATSIYFDIEKILVLGPQSFKPAPKVHSIVLSLQKRKEPLIHLASDEWVLFSKLVRACFAHRRKTVENSLKIEISKVFPTLSSSDTIKKIFSQAKIDEKRRAESIAIEEFYTLYKVCRSMQ